MAEIKSEETGEKKSLNFIEQIVEKDLAEGKNGGRIQTRFPPEPNGYLHIGHAKAICLDFGIAAKYGGVCNLRFDDTNPTKEDMEYIDAIKEDINWLGFQWANVYNASDYFQQLWDFAVMLIKEGKAYIDEQTSEQIAAQKGTPTQPGTNSPYRDRPIEENLRLFEMMNTGEVEEGKMAPDFTLTCRLIDGRYPNYNSVIPQNNPYLARIDRAALISALKRVLVFCDQSSAQVKMAFSASKLTVSGQDVNYATSAEERIVCEYDSPKMNIGFKGTLLLDILGNIDSDEVVFQLADPGRAGIITPAEQKEGEEILMLLMPMMLND